MCYKGHWGQFVEAFLCVSLRGFGVCLKFVIYLNYFF